MAEYLNRNQLWQSAELQDALSNANVVIGGMGGLGWLVGGALIGLGVRRLAVFDPDPLELANLNRLWGCVANHVGSKKIELFKQMAQGVSADITVVAHAEKIPCLAFEDALADADVVFGCYDRPEPRVATQVLSLKAQTLYIDAGVAIQAGKKNDFTGFGQVFVSQASATACIVCAGMRMDSPGYRGTDAGPMASSGVLNGILANLAVSVWLKHLQGEPVAALSRFNWNAHDIQAQKKLNSNPHCPICGANPAWAEAC